jgi:hypothetical protein
MKTFFYSANTSDGCSDCHWQICPRRYLAKLRNIDGLQEIEPISGKLFFFSPRLNTTPKNGDIIVLYAQNSRDLDEMIAMRDGFDGLKKILVVADSSGVDGDRYHMLAPRFITQAQRSIDELDAVIRKMREHIN